MSRQGTSTKRFAAVALISLGALVAGLPAAAQRRPKPELPPGGELKIVPPIAAARNEQLQVLVELNAPGAAEVYAQRMAGAAGLKTASAKAQALAAAQAQFYAIDAAQQQAVAALAAPAIGATEIFRVKRALDAVSVYTTRDKLAAIRALPGVKSVRVVRPEYPTNSTSVPFIGAPQVWTDTLGIGKNLTGAGVKIGIIDTGVDYLHANFGGDGQAATYTAAAAATANFTTLGGGFPSAKVVGGWDFAGDAYTGGNAPSPDPNPMDCGGHGSHVAGTAAGYGVKSDDTTFFPGPYNASDPFGSLKIGPGVAPLASLYALRVFGCGGSTGLTVQAIDWAMDPNNDGDMSDHLDVINMSLGSSFGRLSDTSAMASDAAAAIGVVVVCSTGNAGDTYFIAGSPGNAARAISVAASVDPGGSDGAQLTINTPAGIAGNYLAGYATFGPALTPTGVTGNVVLANDGSAAPTLGCNSAPAWPGMTGNIALVDRGTCAFAVKVKNAQLNGAIGVIIANNTTGIINMSGTDATITIPSLSVSQSDGNTIKAQLGSGVNATLRYGGFPQYADTLASFSSRGPLANSPVFLKPDLTAPGQNITSTLTGWTCDGVTITGCIWPTGVSGVRINPDSQAGVLSGTSMACPHMTGTMALLKQLHPDWSVEELKALAMNTALHNVTVNPSGGAPRFGPDRVGTGREDIPLAAQNNTVAFNGDDTGLVSVSFGTESVNSLTATKTVRVDNKGLTAQTYTLGVETVEDNPGASFSLPGGTSLTVPAGTSSTFTVQLSATSDLLKHTVDPTVAPTQTSAFGTTPRQWLTEEAGYLTFSQGGVLKMRVPLFSAPVPASTMSGGPINTGGNPSGTYNIPLSGSGVCTATHTAGPPEDCTAFSLPTDEISLVSPFELQVVHPADPANIAPYQNLQYAGVNYDSADNIMMFGVSTWGDWATPSDVSFTIYVDCGVSDASGVCTGAPDGIWDRVIVSSDFGSISSYWAGQSYSPNDSFASFYWNLATNGIGASYYTNLLNAAQQDTRLYNTNVMFIPVAPYRMGFGTTSGTTARAFNYKIETCPGWAPACGLMNGFNADSAGTDASPFHFDPTAQGLDFGYDWLSNDLNGSTLPVTFNTANLTANGSLGALLLHHHNAAGQRAQVVLLSPDGSAQGSDIAVTASAAPGNPAINQNVILTVHVVNNGPAAATGVTVTGTGPSSLQYVSDDGGGAFNASSGVWTVGSLANGGAATLHITVKYTQSGPATVTFQVSGSTPLDPNPANNLAFAAIAVGAQADLSVTKTVDNASPLLNSNVTFTITVANAGPDTAYNVVVTDLLNAGFQFVSATPSAGSYNPANGQWTFASLGIGGQETLTLVAKVTIVGPLTNSATVASATADPSAANNQAALNFSTAQLIPLAGPAGLLLLAALLALAGAVALRRLS